jgi:hypothetical protein
LSQLDSTTRIADRKVIARELDADPFRNGTIGNLAELAGVSGR